MHRTPWLFLCFLLLISGCESPVSDMFNYPEDPVARAMGVRWWWEPNKTYDAAVVLMRMRSSYIATKGTTSNSLRMAFDLNSEPVQVTTVKLNGVDLPWIASEDTRFHAHIYALLDTAAGFGAADSAKYLYSGFDGNAFSATTAIAPDFGDAVAPDTISMSTGFVIRYARTVPGDSVSVTVQESLTDVSQVKQHDQDSLFLRVYVPDDGTIIISPEKLPHVRGAGSYLVQVTRFRFSEQRSTQGKLIGIYSDVALPIIEIPAKE